MQLSPPSLVSPRKSTATLVASTSRPTAGRPPFPNTNWVARKSVPSVVVSADRRGSGHRARAVSLCCCSLSLARLYCALQSELLHRLQPLLEPSAPDSDISRSGKQANHLYLLTHLAERIAGRDAGRRAATQPGPAPPRDQEPAARDWPCPMSARVRRLAKQQLARPGHRSTTPSSGFAANHAAASAASCSRSRQRAWPKLRLGRRNCSRYCSLAQTTKPSSAMPPRALLDVAHERASRARRVDTRIDDESR